MTIEIWKLMMSNNSGMKLRSGNRWCRVAEVSFKAIYSTLYKTPVWGPGTILFSIWYVIYLLIINKEFMVEPAVHRLILFSCINTWIFRHRSQYEIAIVKAMLLTNRFLEKLVQNSYSQMFPCVDELRLRCHISNKRVLSNFNCTFTSWESE